MDNRKKIIIKLRNKNLSYREIGERVGISGQRVYSILKYYYKNIKNKEKFCIFCGGIIDLPRRKLYCAKHAHRHLNSREGIDHRRELIRERDNYTCQICGKKWIEGTRRFDVHHLDEENESWENRRFSDGSRNKTGIYQNDKLNMNRMITVCHKCHMNIPQVKYKMSYEYRHKK